MQVDFYIMAIEVRSGSVMITCAVIMLGFDMYPIYMAAEQK